MKDISINIYLQLNLNEFTLYIPGEFNEFTLYIPGDLAIFLLVIFTVILLGDFFTMGSGIQE